VGATCILGNAVCSAAWSPGAVHPGGTLLAAGPHRPRPCQAGRGAESVRDGPGVRPLREGHAAGEGPALVAAAELGAGGPRAGRPAQGWRS
jgi:hypothetical protein